jgi:anti-sigma regulatory factor (Ser/Thr protein kinase)
MQAERPLPPVRERRPDASDSVCRAVEKMTAKDPAQRHQTPREVIGELAPSAAVQAGAATGPAVRPVAEQLEAWRGPSIELEFLPRWKRYLHLVSHALDERLRKAYVGPEFHGNAQTLFIELGTNAFDHGCTEAAEGTVKIRLELNHALFSVEVEDPGEGFDIDATLAEIDAEPLERRRRRGLIQVRAIADVLEHNDAGTRVTAVLYRSESDITVDERGGLVNVEISGRGDIALAAAFIRWVSEYKPAPSCRLLLSLRTEWASSQFVGAVISLLGSLEERQGRFAIWVEHRTCFKNLDTLGITSLVPTFMAYDEAVRALRKD